MVIVFTVQNAQMQRHTGAKGKGAKELACHAAIERTDRLVCKRTVKHKKRTAADIDGAEGERLVHRNEKASVARDRAFVTEHL